MIEQFLPGSIRMCVLALLGATAAPLPAVAQTGSDEAVAPAYASLFEGFDESVREAMERWSVPGLAVAAIHNGEVVLSKGFGYRNVEDRQPVTPSTLFAIGSNTKSFTATLLGMLVDEGRLDWDRPVHEYLPEFRMSDPIAGASMTPADLVTHRSGLPRHDLVWYGSDVSRAEMFNRLRHLEPTAPFRAAWQYQNLMFMTAGYLAEQVAGSSWEDLVDERILTPLGMHRSNFSTDDMPGSGDFAYPYAIRDSQVVRIPFRNIDAIGPAGSINSSVEEMMHYIQFHLNGGEYEGQRLLSEATSRNMQRPHMVMPGERQDPELGFNSYGLGLVVGTYRGHTLVRHGGGIDGFISSMAWLPDDSVGVMVLTNLSGNNPVPGIVTWNVIDRLLGLEPLDWTGRIAARQDSAAENASDEEDTRVEGTSPSHSLDAYVGQYRHPAYGEIDVRRQGTGLAYEFSDFAGALSHWHYDVFRVEPDDDSPLSERLVWFGYDMNGDIDRLTAPLEPSLPAAVFERVREDEGDEPSD